MAVILGDRVAASENCGTFGPEESCMLNTGKTFAIAAAALLGGAGSACAGVVHQITLSGEISFVGEIIDTPLGHSGIHPREADRWSLTVVLDASAPDTLGPDLTRYQSSIVSATLSMDNHPMGISFGGVDAGITVGTAADGTVSLGAELMNDLFVSVIAEGVDTDPGLGLPKSLDPSQGTRARFSIVDQASHVLIAGTFDGYTFGTIVPAPAGVAVLGLAGLGACTRRRRA